MNNLRMLTGGLILIVLGLAGGTGYLIYDRIQSEFAAPDKVTKQEVETIKTDVNTLKDNDKIQNAKIAVLEGDMDQTKGRVTNAEAALERQDKVIKELEKDTAENKTEIASEKEKRKQMQADLEKERKRLDEVEKNLEGAKKERDEIRKKLKEQGEKIDEQERRLTDLEKKGDSRDEELAKLRAELDEVKRLLGLKPVPEN